MTPGGTHPQQKSLLSGKSGPNPVVFYAEIDTELSIKRWLHKELHDLSWEDLALDRCGHQDPV